MAAAKITLEFSMVAAFCFFSALTLGTAYGLTN